MSDEKNETEPQTGRTAWDFAAEVSQKLGLSIVILIGIAFGLYQFQDQALKLKEAERESNKDLQEKLNSAQQQLVDSAVAVGQLNKDMIENIQSGLSELQKLQSSIKLYQEQTEAEARKAVDAIAKQKEAEEATIRAKNDLKKLKLENETQQKLQAAKSGPFKEKVQSLVSKLLDTSSVDPDIEMLAAEIRQDYLVNPLELFQRVAKDPNVENLKRLHELNGFNIDMLLRIIEENETGFAVWMHLHKADLSDSKAVVGVAKVSEDRAIGVVFLGYENEQRRVWEIDIALRFSWVYFPSVHNWDLDSAIGIVDSEDTLYFESVSKVPSDLSKGQMHLTDMLRYATANEDYMCSILVGEDPNLQLIALEDLRAKEPVTFGRLTESREEASTAAMMIRKEETFSAANIVPIILDRGHGDLGNLRSTILEILDAAVKKDNEKRQKHAKKNFQNWGLLASVVLNEHFVMNKLEVSLDRLEVSITCSFLDYETKDILTAKMNFRREQTFKENPWRIAGFVKVPTEPRQSVLQQSLH